MSLPKPDTDWSMTPEEIWNRVDWQANDFQYWTALANLKVTDAQLHIAKDMARSNSSLVGATKSLKAATWVYASAAVLQVLVLMMQVLLYLKK